VTHPRAVAPEEALANVLVVDDEPVVVLLMARALSSGYVVHTATNAQEALAIAGDLPTGPAVLVTDLRMAPVNGADLAKLMVCRWPNTRVLFVSAFDGEHLELPGPLLKKPFWPAQLVEAVGELFPTCGDSTRHRAQEPPSTPTPSAGARVGP
jgi:CheY-like chemotaxis protein